MRLSMWLLVSLFMCGCGSSVRRLGDQERGSGGPQKETAHDLVISGVEFMYVEGRDSQSDLTPKLEGFFISKTEVTVAQYKRCVEAKSCTEPNTQEGCNWEQPDRDDHPVNCVDWEQARAFASWLGSEVELPTSAEWTHAAHGG